MNERNVCVRSARISFLNHTRRYLKATMYAITFPVAFDSTRIHHNSLYCHREVTFDITYKKDHGEISQISSRYPDRLETVRTRVGTFRKTVEKIFSRMQIFRSHVSGNHGSKRIRLKRPRNGRGALVTRAGNFYLTRLERDTSLLGA